MYTDTHKYNTITCSAILIYAFVNKNFMITQKT